MFRPLQIVVIATICVVAFGAGWVSAGAASQAPGVIRHVLLKEDTSLPGREAIMAMVELPPGAAEGRHTHPAEVYAFVLEGAPTLEVEGQPTITLKAGEVFRMPPGKVHQAINNGSQSVKLAAVFVAEKGKPLTTQVTP